MVALDVLLGGGVRQRELDRDGRVLRWLEAGEGRPPVVFEAGAMSPAVSFAAVFTSLAPDHRVVAYDRAHVDVDLQINDLAALLEAVGPAIVVGHSWGGLLAQLVAWERPELISGLVLVDPSHETFWTELPPETLAELGRHPSRTSSPHADPRCAEMISYGRELADDVARSVGGDPQIGNACLSYLSADDQLLRYLDEVPMILDHLEDLVARRSQAVWPRIPVVLLTATKGRPADSTAQVIAVQEQVVAAANGRHIVVPEAGHYIHVDLPDLVTQAVHDVARVGSSVRPPRSRPPSARR